MRILHIHHLLFNCFIYIDCHIEKKALFLDDNELNYQFFFYPFWIGNVAIFLAKHPSLYFSRRFSRKSLKYFQIDQARVKKFLPPLSELSLVFRRQRQRIFLNTTLYSRLNCLFMQPYMKGFIVLLIYAKNEYVR